MTFQRLRTSECGHKFYACYIPPFSSLTLSFNGYQSGALPCCCSLFRKVDLLFCARYASYCIYLFANDYPKPATKAELETLASSLE